jgi:ABC-2 type transport system permease protein
LFPLDLLPVWLQHVLYFTPFPYQLYVPIGIYMGKIVGMDLWLGLLAQFAWVMLAYLFARFMWARGIKKYAAFGG